MRKYILSGAAANLSVGLELFNIYNYNNNSPINHPVMIFKRLVISPIQVSLPTQQAVAFSLDRFQFQGGNSASQNTTGSSATAEKTDPADIASYMSCYVGNIQPGQTGTYKDFSWNDGFYLYTGRDIILNFNVVVPFWWILRLLCPNASSGTVTVNWAAEWEEIGQ